MINFKVQNQLEKIEQINQDMIIPIIDNNNLKGVSPDKFATSGGGKPVNLFLDQNLTHIPTCPAENMDWLIDKRIPLEVWTANNTTDVTTLHSYITGVTADNVHVGEKIANL